MLVYIFTNVKNVKPDLNHYKATAVYIVVMGQLNVRQYKLEKIVAKTNTMTKRYAKNDF